MPVAPATTNETATPHAPVKQEDTPKEQVAMDEEDDSSESSEGTDTIEEEIVEAADKEASEHPAKEIPAPQPRAEADKELPAPQANTEADKELPAPQPHPEAEKEIPAPQPNPEAEKEIPDMSNDNQVGMIQAVEVDAKAETAKAAPGHLPATSADAAAPGPQGGLIAFVVFNVVALFSTSLF